MSKEENTSFNTLRSLMQHSTLHNNQRKDLYFLLREEHERDAQAYEEKWVPYIKDFQHHFERPLWVSDPFEFQNKNEALGKELVPFRPIFALMLDLEELFHLDKWDLSWAAGLQLSDSEDYVPWWEYDYGEDDNPEEDIAQRVVRALEASESDLRYLRIDFLPLVSAQILDSLQQLRCLKNLRVLDIRGGGVTQARVKAAVEKAGLEQLEDLRISPY